MRLRAKHQSTFRVVEEDMCEIRASGEHTVERVTAGFVDAWKFVARIVCQLVRPVINLLFGNYQYLAELTLNGGLESVFTLDLFQMERAQDHQSRGGQYHGQLKRQYQASSLVPAAFQFHFWTPDPDSPWISPAHNIVEPDRRGVNATS